MPIKNVELNAGGIIGGLLCGGIAAAIIFGNGTPENAGRGLFRMPIFALIGGALAGNYLWALVFRKKDD